MFHAESLLIRFLTKVCDVLFLNAVFVVSCATVVFSGTAVTSLYAVALKMIRSEDYEPVKGFLRAARENFLPSFPATILLMADMALIAALHRILYAEVLIISPTVFVFLVIVAFLLTALLSWLFPLTARFENTFVRHLGNAGRLALANLPVHIMERITVNDLARAIFVSPTHLSRIFKQETGVSVSEYIRQRKIDMAKNYLQFTNYELADISAMLSYSSQSHFIQHFRSQVGMTPKAYRKKYYLNNWNVNRDASPD